MSVCQLQKLDQGLLVVTLDMSKSQPLPAVKLDLTKSTPLENSGQQTNELGKAVIVPKDGESFADTLARAAQYGKSVSQQISMMRWPLRRVKQLRY